MDGSKVEPGVAGGRADCPGGAGGGCAWRLTGAVASGDGEAFARFYEAWFDRAYAMARRACGRDESFCLDVVQESFVKMIRRMRRMESEAALGAWVRRVVTRTAYDMLREERRRGAREAARGGVGSGAASREGVEDAAARLRWLEEELGRMKKEEAELVLARHRFGWTLSAIGGVFGLAPGAVDGRVGRIVGRLRARAKGAERE